MQNNRCTLLYDVDYSALDIRREFSMHVVEFLRPCEISVAFSHHLPRPTDHQKSWAHIQRSSAYLNLNLPTRRKFNTRQWCFSSANTMQYNNFLLRSLTVARGWIYSSRTTGECESGEYSSHWRRWLFVLKKLSYSRMVAFASAWFDLWPGRGGDIEREDITPCRDLLIWELTPLYPCSSVWTLESCPNTGPDDQTMSGIFISDLLELAGSVSILVCCL